MQFETEITIMGRNSTANWYDYVREPLARGVEKVVSPGTIFMQDVKSFAVGVIASADGGMIKRLNIIDHGNEQGCWFGSDYIDEKNFEKHVQYLAKVSPSLTKSAIVHLRHCRVGQNQDLLRMFALTFGVKVYAGTGIDAGIPVGHNWGDYVGCTPGGTIFKEVKRP